MTIKLRPSHQSLKLGYMVSLSIELYSSLVSKDYTFGQRTFANFSNFAQG